MATDTYRNLPALLAEFDQLRDELTAAANRRCTTPPGTRRAFVARAVPRFTAPPDY